MVQSRRLPLGLRGLPLAVCLVLVTGCGSTATPESVAQPTHDGATHDGAAHSGSGPAAAAPTALPASGDLVSSCSADDPKAGSAELKTVQLVREGDQLVLAFTLAGQVPDDLQVKVVAVSGTVSTPATPAAGFSVTTALQAGAPAAVTYQTPTGSVAAEHPEELVHVVDHEVHVGLPSSILDPLGPQWHWSTTSAGGGGRGQCPVGAGGTVGAVAVGG